MYYFNLVYVHSTRSVQIDVQTTQEVYIGALQDSKYDSADLQGVHTLEDKAVATLDPR